MFISLCCLDWRGLLKTVQKIEVEMLLTLLLICTVSHGWPQINSSMFIGDGVGS